MLSKEETMRLSILTLICALAFSIIAKAEDNVIVDLSVLDGLSNNYIAPSEPLFPILPKKAKVSKPIKKEIKKSKSKNEVVAKIPDDKESVVVVDVEPVSMPNNKVETTENKDGKANTIKHAASDDFVVVVDKEPVDPKPDPLVNNGENAADVEPMKENDTDNKSELLVPEISDAPVPTVNNSIKFADDIDELSAEQMVELDRIISHFKDANTNKIAIYSYNLDNGVDVFKKKRISLNRAVEVRSYLLKQGYKNFSIKVINVNSNSDKINSVELEEI